MNTQKVETVINSLDKSKIDKYKEYWGKVAPQYQEDFFRRWLFSFCSVHTTWKQNVNAYNLLKELDWIEDKSLLLDKLNKSGCGLQNNRARYIWHFKEEFERNPEKFCSKPTDWQQRRNDLTNSLLGLGIAKVSFALEMCFPLEAQLTCCDIHHIKLYELPTENFKTKAYVKLYHDVENHWVNSSLNWGAPSYIMRCLFWDKTQGKDDSRYWSYVLEDNYAS